MRYAKFVRMFLTLNKREKKKEDEEKQSFLW